MRPAAIVVGLATLGVVVPGAAAQRPTVSPRLERAVRSDSTLLIWLFARRSAALEPIEDAVQQLGGRVRHTSRWLHAVSAEVPSAAVEFFRARPDLRHLQPVTVFRRDTSTLTARPPDRPTALPALPAATAVDGPYGPSAMPLRRLNLFPLVERGFRGTGVRIAILDSGFETGLPAFSSVSVVAQRDFVFGDDIVRDEPQDQPGASQHGTEVWSLLAANVPDTILGIAPNAQYLLAKVEDVRQEVRMEEDNYVAALEWAATFGVDVVNSSLSYFTFDDGSGYTFDDLNGDIAVTTVAADAAAALGIVVVTAVGNAGTAGSRSLHTPADGDSVLAVGAEDSLGFLAGFSSQGPTADGRMKPDFTAPGVAVLALAPVSGAQTYPRVSGTSFSTPVLAGAIALLREIHPALSPTAVRTALRLTATNRAAPDSLLGWGRPDLFVSAIFPSGVTVTQPAGGGAVAEVTPRFQWAAGGAPAFAQPVTFRLRLWRDASRAELLFDTTTTTTSVTFPPLAPASTFVFELAATGADSARVVIAPAVTFTLPPWVTLTTLNDPAGLTIRDATPLFAWQAAQVHPPFQPMTFDLRVFREDDDALEIQALDLTDTMFEPPRDLEFNTPYRWQVTARVAGDSVTVQSAGPFVIVRDEVPAVTTLFQNFPNPFPNTAIGQTSTCLWFDLANQGGVSLDILDVRGHVVRRLIPAPGLGPFFPAGRYGRPAMGSVEQCDPRFEWDGTAGDGRVAPAGLYLAKLTTPDGSFFRRIVFLGSTP